MARLTFPVHEVVGELEWPGQAEWPVLATGVVTVPDGSEVTLLVSRIESARRPDRPGQGVISVAATGDLPEPGARTRDLGTGWQIENGDEPVDLGFLRQLPADSITDLSVTYFIVPGSFSAVTHLAAGLRTLRLAATDLGDEALRSVAELRGLTTLQMYGNRFTDSGMQQLAALQGLENLYVEEEGLSASAFEFADRLPRLADLDFGDVWPTPMTSADLSRLKARLPSVNVSYPSQLAV